MERQQLAQVDVYELVAVQREEVALSLPLRRGEADAPAPAERLVFGDGDDLRAETAERRRELLLLAGRAADEHAVDTGRRELLDLVGGQRPTANLHERLRPPGRGVAETLCLAPRQNHCLHYRSSWCSRSSVSGREASGEAARPIPS